MCSNAGVEAVVVRFADLGKAGQTAQLAQAAELLPASCQDFPGIGLVPDIEDNLVARKRKRDQQGDGHLDHPEIGREMAAVAETVRMIRSRISSAVAPAGRLTAT
jgi:hypothetical protein